MANVSVRVPSDLKKAMDKLPWINWTEILRKAITETVNSQVKRNLAHAVLLSEKLRRNPAQGWNSTEFILTSRSRDKRED